MVLNKTRNPFSILPSAIKVANFTILWQPSNIYNISKHTQDDTFRFPLASSEVNLAMGNLIDKLFGFDLQTSSNPQNQTQVILSRWLLAEGRCTFDQKCTKFITVKFSILGHIIYSVVFIFPTYNLCLFVRLQKLPLELSVLIKYQLFF